ncbi:hypothetical protein evm_002271 [Chilo suppressalis]|nr:hypothetical protein evm_002271 [Chilo suppressalis]
MPKMLRSHRSDRIPFDESTESRHNTDPTLPRRQETMADGGLRNWIPRWPTRSELILKILIITRNSRSFLRMSLIFLMCSPTEIMSIDLACSALTTGSQTAEYLAIVCRATINTGFVTAECN